MAAFRKLAAGTCLIFILLQSMVLFGQSIEKMNAGVVRIEVEPHEGVKRGGTGFIVAHVDTDAVYIVTAAHVVAYSKNVEIEFYNRRNRFVQAKIVKNDPLDPHGLALLLVEGKIPSEISVFTFNPSVKSNDAVSIIGFPLSLNAPWSLYKGNIIGREGKTISFGVTGDIVPGISGGPVIKNGEVVGVVTESKGRNAIALSSEIAEPIIKNWGVKPGLVAEIVRNKIETAEWDKLKNRQDLLELREFLNKFPNGKYSRSARAQISLLEEQDFWEGVKDSRNPNVIESYLYKYPNGRFVQDAKELINERTRSKRKIPPKPKKKENKFIVIP